MNNEAMQREIKNGERLQKRLVAAGVASRRKAEELIRDGRVKVDNVIITEMGYIVSPKAEIKVDNVVINKELKKYYCMNKPRSVISSVSDDKGRKTIIDIIPDKLKTERLFPVGRLDYDTKGIILITNDGEFMNALVGPKSGIQKEYLVRVEGVIKKEELIPFEKGLTIKGQKYLPALTLIESVDYKNKSSLVRIIITEGKYHQVKEMFAAINHPVKRMNRIRFGNITIEGLKEGEIRSLTPHEVKVLIELSKHDKVLKSVKNEIKNCRKY